MVGVVGSWTLLVFHSLQSSHIFYVKVLVYVVWLPLGWISSKLLEAIYYQIDVTFLQVVSEVDLKCFLCSCGHCCPSFKC